MRARLHVPLRLLVAVSAFGLILAACTSTDGALDPSNIQSTTSPDPGTTAPVQPTTSTTAAVPTTSEAPGLVALTANAGEIRVIVAADAAGELPDDTLIGCRSGSSFPASALIDVPLLSDSGLPEVEEAITPFLESAEGDFWPQDGWRVLDRTDDRVLLVHSDTTRTEPSISFMETERDGDEWRWAGSSMGGPCPLEVKVTGGLNAVDWRLEPSAEPLTPSSSVIHVLVTERACASGQAMGDRLRGPEVIVTDTDVLIAFAAESQQGGQNCQGNPETAVTIELSGPIGARAVTDGLALDTALEDLLSD
ncbi:MAG: hypothetical protein ABFR53_03845 [Actinomycetota bacterium]